jgi:hypothetical protein
MLSTARRDLFSSDDCADAMSEMGDNQNPKFARLNKRMRHHLQLARNRSGIAGTGGASRKGKNDTLTGEAAGVTAMSPSTPNACPSRCQSSHDPLSLPPSGYAEGGGLLEALGVATDA